MTESALRMVQEEPATMPHSYEAEQALLGAILARNGVYDDVADILRPEHFADALHGRIFEAAGTLINAGGKASPISLGRQFDQDPALARAGGAKYLVQLQASAPTLVGLDGFARQIVDLYQRRAAIEAAREMMAQAQSGDVSLSARAIIEQLEAQLGEITSADEPARETVTAGEAAYESIRQTEAAMNAGGGITGVTTGLADLDDRLGGLQATDLIIVAGRPSMGKSALASNLTRACAGHRDPDMRRPVYFAAAEMGREQMGARWLAEITGIPTERQRRGELHIGDMDRLLEAQRDIADWRVLVDDTANTSVQTIRSRARRYARQMGDLGLVVVDYLQLLVSERRSDSRVAEVSQITRGLKMLAKELDCAVVAVSQLSRKCEEREDKRPQLADLRDSGSIEQDADVVIFVYRDEYYLERSEPKEGSQKHEAWIGAMADARNKAELIIPKVRMGRTGKVITHWSGERGLFSDLARQQQSMFHE